MEKLSDGIYNYAQFSNLEPPIVGKRPWARYFVKHNPQLFLKAPSKRAHCKLSENHKINVIGSTELNLWLLRDASFTQLIHVLIC